MKLCLEGVRPNLPIFWNPDHYASSLSGSSHILPDPEHFPRIGEGGGRGPAPDIFCQIRIPRNFQLNPDPDEKVPLGSGLRIKTLKNFRNTKMKNASLTFFDHFFVK